jgi:Ca-activated chloride channel family protein
VRARYEMADFVQKLTGDRVGLIGFAGSSFVFVPLTTDYAAFETFIEDLDPDLIPVQGTDIAGALRKAIASFATQVQTASKAVILVTDGEDTVGLDPTIIDEIKKQDIKIFVMGVGSAEGAPIPLPTGGYKTDKNGNVVMTKLDEVGLQKLATETGGGYVRSVTGDLDLEQIYFGGIKRAFADEQLTAAEKKIPHYQFTIFILLGLIFVVLEILTTHRKRFWLSRFWRSRTKKTVVGMILLSGLLFSTSAQAYNPFTFESANRDYDNKNYEKSAETYQRLLKENPQSPELLFNLGNALYQLQKYQEAGDTFTKAIPFAGTKQQRDLYYNLGDAYYRQNKLKESLGAFAKAKEMDPNFKEAELNYEFVKKKLEEKDQKDEKDEKDKKDKEQEQEQQQEQRQQQRDQKDQSDPSTSLRASQKDKQQEKQNQQEQQNQENQEQQNQQQQPFDSAQGKQFKYDNNPLKMLESIEDNPKDVMQKMIRNQAIRQKQIEKDW